LTPNRSPRAGSERLTVRSFFDSSLITTSTTEGWCVRSHETKPRKRNHGNASPSLLFFRARRRCSPSASTGATTKKYTEKKALTTPYVSRLSYVRRFISAFACAAVLDACFLCVVVGRAKKCLDFAATTYLVHFASCCAVAGVPKGAGWWVTTGVALSVTAILGEYLCVSRELRDIPVAGGR
jgi:hypothetical protein